jgi:hypothetical protein
VHSPRYHIELKIIEQRCAEWIIVQFETDRAVSAFLAPDDK